MCNNTRFASYTKPLLDPDDLGTNIFVLIFCWTRDSYLHKTALHLFGSTIKALDWLITAYWRISANCKLQTNQKQHSTSHTQHLFLLHKSNRTYNLTTFKHLCYLYCDQMSSNALFSFCTQTTTCILHTSSFINNRRYTPITDYQHLMHHHAADTVLRALDEFQTFKNLYSDLIHMSYKVRTYMWQCCL